MTHQHEIDAAYFQGLREGFDPETAADLGIPTSLEEVEQHIESAKEVAVLIGAVVVEETVDGQAEHDALDKKYGRVVCANCNRPGCKGCGKS